jgi:hypothetical protein
MTSLEASGNGSLGVQRVVARVDLQSRVLEQIRVQAEAGDAGSPKRVQTTNANSESLNVYVSLSAHTSDGRHIRTDGPDFAVAGPRRGPGAIWHRYHGPRPAAIFARTYRVGPPDIEDAINQMLGRDPKLHRPPRLAWNNLITALAKAGVDVSEQALIEAPLTVELGPEVQAEIDER